MSNKGDFFIGWQDQIELNTKSFLQKKKWYFFIALMVCSSMVVLLQKPYNDHKFEFGKLTEITGYYYGHPFPMLVPDEGQLDPNLSNGVLLVGYGKYGAEGIMDQISSGSEDLSGKRITLRGSLIYGDGKTLLELTEQVNSLMEIKGDDRKPAQLKGRAPVSLSGEILDPKCYFGVMKPGEGKIHKSCAIRCISGGIPPVFRHETGRSEDRYTYHLMLDENSNKVNDAVLPLVGERINLQGSAANFMGWDIVYVNLDELHN